MGYGARIDADDGTGASRNPLLRHIRGSAPPGQRRTQSRELEHGEADALAAREQVGACAAATPCSGQLTRGASASRNTWAVPRSRPQQRRRPAPRS